MSLHLFLGGGGARSAVMSCLIPSVINLNPLGQVFAIESPALIPFSKSFTWNLRPVRLIKLSQLITGPHPEVVKVMMQWAADIK